MLSRRVVVLAAAAIFISGCQPEGIGGESHRGTESSGTSIEAIHTDVARVAHQLAMAMESDSVRQLVRDAMRASLVTEHKLVLQDFVGTPAGHQVLVAAAKVVNQSADELLERIRRLPALDFYVPFREHRLAWTGTPNVLIASNVDTEAPLNGYQINGGFQEVDRRRPSIAMALLVLQPAEHKSERVAPQASRPGAVIQDAGDGEISGSITVRNPDGTSRTLEFADLPQFAQCTIETCPGGGGGGGGQPGSLPTKLRAIQMFDMCDNNMCGEGNELHFVATASNGATLEIHKDNLYPNSVYSGINMTQLSVSPASGFFVDVHVRETDAWPNGDDHLYYVTYNPNDVLDPHLTMVDDERGWDLKESPYFGVFDDVKVAVVWGW